MITSLLSIVSGANEISSLHSWLSNFATKNRGPKRALLAEISANFKVFKVLAQNDIDVSEIIPALRTNIFDQLETSNFSFNSLQHKKVKLSKLGVRNIPSLSFVDGITTEDLVCRLYERIRVMQSLVAASSKNSKLKEHVRFDVRLQNFAKLLLILVLHLKS